MDKFLIFIIKFIIPFKIKEYIKKIIFIKNFDVSETSFNLFGNKFWAPKTNFFEKSNIYYRIIINEEKEKLKIRYIESIFKPDCYIDVGANIGYWSYFRIINSKKTTQFICIEPSEITFKFLKKNLSKYINCKLFNFGLSNIKEIKELSFPEWEDNNSIRKTNLGLRSIFGNTNILKEKINLEVFDSFFLKTMNNFESIYIKIDTEGYELNILKGMINTIKLVNNVIIEIEFNKQIDQKLNTDNYKEKINLLKKLNLKPYAFNGEKFNIISYNSLINKYNEGVSNFLFLKKINF